MEKTMVAALALLSVVVVSLVSLVGVLTLFWNSDRVRAIALAFVGFAVGALLGDALIHLLPEAYSRGSAPATSGWVLCGIGVFFVLEKFLRRTWRGHLKPSVGVNLVGDGLHNFIDGMLIGASYLDSLRLGITTTIAVVLHEIPQEFGDFGVLINGGLAPKRALLWNLASGLTAVAGTVVALVIGSKVQAFAQDLLPLTAGGFLYLALADLVPDLHEAGTSRRASIEQVLEIAAGVGIMFALLLID